MAQGGAVGAGRSTAIVLFTDLVGSTELRSRLGEDAAEELRHEHDALVAGAVEAGRGNLVKNLGDGIMATFTGASDALAAAVAIQQAIGRHNRSSAAPLEVRIGISAGDVVAEGDDYFGTPVIEAARLCGAAAGGQILASEMVRWLARSGEGTFTPVGSLELKGLPDPVPAVQIDWEPLPEPSVPLPAFLTDIGRIFVGRDDELERLGQVWKEAMAGELRVALLAGEPGVGKTRLAAEVATAVHEQGATVLAGRCDEDLGVPYQPFVEALRHFVDHTRGEDLRERLGRYGGELVRLLPELAGRVPDLAPPLKSEPETERYRLFDAVAAWLAAAAAEESVLLVLDDLQWAAKPTLLLLRHVVRTPTPMRLLVLGTYRDTELGPGHPLPELLADLRRDEAIERLSLAGLDESGVLALAEQAAGHDLEEEERALARVVHGETMGNPFFVWEVLRHLAETGAVVRREGRWVTTLPRLGIPEGVRDVVGRRLSRLSETANLVLASAAVIGADFEIAVLRAVCGLDEGSLIVALDEAAGSRLVAEAGPGAYRFVHALVRDTLYGDLSGARRVAVHCQVAEAIEAVHAGRLDDHLPALAHHWGRASTPPTYASRAALYATRAGDRALAQLAHDEAASYYRQALDLLDVAEGPVDETWRIDVLIGLGEAEHRSGEAAYRVSLLEAGQRAERLGDADRLARAALAGYRGLWDTTRAESRLVPQADAVIPRNLSVDTDRVTLLEAALRTRGDRQDLVRTRLLAVLAGELIWAADRNRRRQLSDEALVLARRLGDRRTLARVLLSRCMTIWDPATLDERRDNAAELWPLAVELGDPFVKVWASMFCFETAMEGTDVEEADRHLEEGKRSASELEQAMWWLATFPEVGRVLMAGRLEEADALAREVLEIGLATQPHQQARNHYGIQRFQIRLEQGRLEEVVGKLADAVGDVGQPETRAMLAEAYCELGSWDEARAVFDVLAPGLPDLPLDPTWILTVTRSAAVCAQLGDTSTAVTLYDLLLPYSGRVAGQGVVWTGSVAHYLGVLGTVLGEMATAEAHFAAAAAVHARMGAPTWLARTRLEWARVLLARRGPGVAERARKLLGQSVATAREIGLGNVERRAVELLKTF
ncbi:MAG: ATP-binding protein [Acidimicrobiia bacterium]